MCSISEFRSLLANLEQAFAWRIDHVRKLCWNSWLVRSVIWKICDLRIILALWAVVSLSFQENSEICVQLISRNREKCLGLGEQSSIHESKHFVAMCQNSCSQYFESFRCSNSWFSEMKQFLRNFIPGTTGPSVPFSFVIFRIFASSVFSVGSVTSRWLDRESEPVLLPEITARRMRFAIVNLHSISEKLAYYNRGTAWIILNYLQRRFKWQKRVEYLTEATIMLLGPVSSICVQCVRIRMIAKLRWICMKLETVWIFDLRNEIS